MAHSWVARAHSPSDTRDFCMRNSEASPNPDPELLHAGEGPSGPPPCSVDGVLRIIQINGDEKSIT